MTRFSTRLGAATLSTAIPMNPALAIGIDPATGAVLNRTVEVWGTQQNFPTAYAYVYSWIFEYGLPGRMVASAGYQGSTDHHLIRDRQSEFPLSEQSRLRTGLFPSARRELELQCAQPGR